MNREHPLLISSAGLLFKQLKDFPTDNHTYYKDGKIYYKVLPEQINLGVAVGLPNQDGVVTLLCQILKVWIK